MKNTTFLVLILFLFSLSNHTQAKDIRIMSFNIWVGGGKSVECTAKVITQTKADIIGIQESSTDESNTAVHIADSLGWYSYSVKSSPTIISKYAIVDTSFLGYGVKIQLDATHFVWMFNVHLHYCPYEPYQLNGISYCDGPLLSTGEEAIASAWKTRKEEVLAAVKDIQEIQKEGYPIFLTGDFNEPSCLDWTTRATKAGLCKTTVVWPATKSFQNQADMKDSYRTIYPNEVEKPGHTWTTRPEKEHYQEILDRIDFVFYWGKQVKPVKASIVGEKSKWSDIGFPDYPSDHRAVMTTFYIK